MLLFNCQIMPDSSWPQGLEHARLLCPWLFPRVCPSSCPMNQWCHPTISSSVVPFSSCHRSFPASGSFPVSWLFVSGGQSIEASASASVLPKSIQGWFPLGLTDLISLVSKGLWRVLSRTTIRKHQFLSVQSNSHPSLPLPHGLCWKRRFPSFLCLPCHGHSTGIPLGAPDPSAQQALSCGSAVFGSYVALRTHMVSGQFLQWLVGLSLSPTGLIISWRQKWGALFT